MRYVTHCPSCGTAFKIVDDQLRIAQGWVRCGHCQAVYKAKETLSIVVDDEPPQSEAHSPATPTASAATSRTNASTTHASASAPTPKVTSAETPAASAPIQAPSPSDDSPASQATPASARADAPDAPAQDSPPQKTGIETSDEASSAAAPHDESGTGAPQPATSSKMLDRIAAIVAAKKAALSKARPTAHAHSSAAANTTPQSPQTDHHPTEAPKAPANNTAPLLLEAPTDTPKALPAPTPSPDAALLALTHASPQKDEATSAPATESTPAAPHTDQASDKTSNKHAHLTSAGSLQTADGPRANTPTLPAPTDAPPMLEWEPLTEETVETSAETPAPANTPSAPSTPTAQGELPSSAVLPWQEGEPFPNPQPIVPLALTHVDDEAPGTPATDAASSPNTTPSAQPPEAASEPNSSPLPAADAAHPATTPVPAAIAASKADQAPDTAHTAPSSGTSTKARSSTSEASKHSGQTHDPTGTDGLAALSPNAANAQTKRTDHPAVAAHTGADMPGMAPVSASASCTPEAVPTAAPAMEQAKAADAATAVQSVIQSATHPATESASEPSSSSDAAHHQGSDQEQPAAPPKKTAGETAAPPTASTPSSSSPTPSAHTAQGPAAPSQDATAPNDESSSASPASAAPAAKAESDAEALLRRRARREQRRLKSKASARSRKRSGQSRSAQSKKPRGLKALWQALLRPFKPTPAAAPPVQPPALPAPKATSAVTPITNQAPAPSSEHTAPAATSSAKAAEQPPLLVSGDQASTSANSHKASDRVSQAHGPASDDPYKAAPSSTAADAAAAHSPTKDEALVPAAPPVAAVQTTTPSANAAPIAATASHDENFAFMRDAQRRAFWRKPQVRAGLAAGIVLGALTLAGQWAYQHRSPLAARMPLARAAFEALRLPVPPWQNIQAIEIEDSDFLKNPDNSYQLRVSLRNSSTHPVAMPALELALLDDDEQVVTRRVLQADPALPMPAVIPPRGQWQTTVEVWVQLPPELAQRDIAGYRVAVFYP